ncbi:hypothetical protein [Bosea sp. 685]|uniref:hypothetical protein n=1 Tax=Bosea sp. 685 TaxID=3080057 RepID=UPI0028937229|nr:hypothetical protein [Bosea sp. 685]WNJ90126.1 hypothetical protein RMR04_27675 [Bosea sp. 685]
MKNFGGHVGVAVFGALSFALTVALVTVISRVTGFNLFSLSVWIVIPAGAMITGAAAASGYYFGSLLFHTRPTWFLLVQVIVVAALAQLAIYYGEYSTLVLQNGVRVADRIGFSEYMDLTLTSAHLRVGRAQTDTGAVGSFGYWLAAFQFVGFILGGVATYFFLRRHPVCQSCSRYLRTLATRKQHINDNEVFSTYYDNLFKHPVDGPEFAEWLQYDPDNKQIKEGTVLATSTLKGCPHCKTQRIEQRVTLHGKKDWKDIPTLARNIAIPDGIDLRSVFKGEVNASRQQRAEPTLA